MNINSENGVTVEILPVSYCPHCGLVPHHITPGGVLDCAACLQRPNRYALPREVRNGE